MNEWDRLLDQAFLTLNLLQTARANPSLSAYTYLFGDFNFNATPLAPPGTRVLAHLKTTVRGTWDSHVQEGWYVGPSMQHYRYVKCFLLITRREIDCDAVTFMPKHIKFPNVNLEDFESKQLRILLASCTNLHPPLYLHYLQVIPLKMHFSKSHVSSTMIIIQLLSYSKYNLIFKTM